MLVFYNIIILIFLLSLKEGRTDFGENGTVWGKPAVTRTRVSGNLHTCVAFSQWVVRISWVRECQIRKNVSSFGSHPFFFSLFVSVWTNLHCWLFEYWIISVGWCTARKCSISCSPVYICRNIKLASDFTNPYIGIHRFITLILILQELANY